MAQKEFLSNAGLEHYDEKIKEYIGDHSSNDIVALKEESPATAAHSIGDYITYNHIVYKVIDNISVDDLLIVDSNIEVATLAEGTVIYSDDDDGGGGGTTNYNDLDNKPQVNGVELSGNKSATDLGLVASVEGKGLSTNDYSDTEKGKVADNTSTIEAMINVNGSKNILPFDINTIKANNTTGTWSGNAYSLFGVIFTVNADNTISVSGTSTDIATLNLNSAVKYSVNHDCILSGCPSGGAESKYYIQAYGPNIYPTETGNGITMPIAQVNDSSGWFARIVIKPAAGNVSLLFKPMLRDARIIDPTYAPYAMTNRELTEKVNDGVLRISSISVASTTSFTANTPQEFTVDLSPGWIVLDLMVVAPTSGAQYFNIIRTGAHNKFRVMSSVAQSAQLTAIIIK